MGKTYRATFGGALASRELGRGIIWFLIVTCLYTAVW